MQKKIKLALFSVALGLSLIIGMQPQIINTVGSDLQSFFNFGQTTTDVNTGATGLATYHYPFKGQSKPFFNLALQENLVYTTVPKIDNGLAQRTLRTATINPGTYFDFESGQTSYSNFTTADLYMDVNQTTCPVILQGSTLGKDLGFTPFNAVDYKSYSQTGYPPSPCTPTKPDFPSFDTNGSVSLWKTREGNYIRAQFTQNGLGLDVSYDYLFYISIDGNTDLLSKAQMYGWPGTGTSTDPIVISGYNVSLYDVGGFSISNTSLYVTFQGNTFNGMDGAVEGLVLYNVQNIDFESNKFSYYTTGIEVEKSSNLSFNLNTVLFNQIQGVFVYQSTSTIFTGNEFSFNGASGLTAYESSVDVFGNNFNSNGIISLKNPTIITAGITFVSSYGYINSNNVTNTKSYGIIGVDILPLYTIGNFDAVVGNGPSVAQNLLIDNNNITGTNLDGVIIVSSDSINLASNTVNMGLGNGITVSSSTRIGLSGNSITNNVQDGIHWLHSWNGTIVGNTVIGNSNLALQFAKTGKLNPTGFYSGMLMDPSYFNVIAHNNFNSNGNGVIIQDSGYNNFTVNNVGSNSLNGLAVINSSSNYISSNAITGNVDPYLAYNLTQYSKAGSLNPTGFYSGMLMDPSLDNVIYNNTISGNYGNGIQIQDSDNNTLNNNNINMNAADGAFIQNSNYNTITGNDFSQNSNPALQAVLSSVLKTGTLNPTGFYSGMLMDPSTNNYVVNNNFGTNYGNGVHIQDSDTNTFGFNNITNNALNGFFVENSNDNQIAYNTIYGNVNPNTQAQVLNYGKPNSLNPTGFYSGMLMDPSQNNKVFGNQINANYGDGVSVQSSDNNQFSANHVNENAGNGMSIINSNNNQITKNTLSSNSNPVLQMERYSVLSSFKLSNINPTGFYSGMLMDPSSGNTVSGNVINNNPGIGVWLQLSDNNVFDGNTISNSGQHGVFIDNSNSNSIQNNDVFGNGNTSVLGTFLNYAKLGSLNPTGFYSGMLMDPSTGNIIKDNQIHNNNGNGFSAQDSSSNTLSGNSMTYNSNQGLYAGNSSSLTITENSFSYNGKEGTYFDTYSKDSNIDNNDFVANDLGSGSIQAYDDGGNTFSANFFSNENPNTPYIIAGSANSIDTSVSLQPNTNLASLNFPPLEVKTYVWPVKLNVKSEGWSLTAWVYFPSGYSSYLVNRSSIYAEWNGNIYPAYRSGSFGPHWLYIKFNRHALVHDAYQFLVANKLSSTFIQFTIHGEFNGGYLKFYGTNSIYAFKIGHDDDYGHHRGRY